MHPDTTRATPIQSPTTESDPMPADPSRAARFLPQSDLTGPGGGSADGADDYARIRDTRNARGAMGATLDADHSRAWALFLVADADGEEKAIRCRDFPLY